MVFKHSESLDSSTLLRPVLPSSSS